MIFRYLARLMMVVPGATIHTLREFMEHPETMRPYLSKLDPTSKIFFETQFFAKMYDDTRRQILTRLWGVIANSVLARMFAHPRNRVDLFAAMNRGSLILINTAKDLLKQDGCEILGRFFLALIAQATQERAALPEERRRATFLYIDEAQDYFDEGMEQLLNQARNYRVGLILAHQNLGQFEPRLQAAVMASTAIKLAGGVSAKDATTLAREMRCDPGIPAGDAKALRPYRVCLLHPQSHPLPGQAHRSLWPDGGRPRMSECRASDPAAGECPPLLCRQHRAAPACAGTGCKRDGPAGGVMTILQSF